MEIGDFLDYALKIDKLKKKYNDFDLNIESLTVPYGTIVGFVGPNGHGKSTTIKCILNLISYDSGDIQLFGKSTKKYDTLCKEDIAVVFDEFCFDDEMKPKILSKVLNGVFKKWSSKTFNYYLAKFKLPNTQFKNYSKGMKMKLMIAVALSHEAKLLILDEPTSGLDPISRCEILEELKNYVNNEKSIFFSTHITSDLERISDTIAMIFNGKIILYESTQKLLNQYYTTENINNFNQNNYELIKQVKLDGENKYLIKTNEDNFAHDAKKLTIDELMLFMVNQ